MPQRPATRSTRHEARILGKHREIGVAAEKILVREPDRDGTLCIGKQFTASIKSDDLVLQRALGNNDVLFNVRDSHPPLVTMSWATYAALITAFMQRDGLLSFATADERTAVEKIVTRIRERLAIEEKRAASYPIIKWERLDWRGI